jgi:GNAT superfamily N-acetyltransferase
MSVTVGVPGPGDAAALAALMADTFIETYAADSDAELIAAHIATAFDPETVAHRLADPRRTTLWLLDSGQAVGFLSLNTGGAQTVEGLADGLEVEQVYLRASHHGQGLGAMLLGRAVTAARELGLGFVWLGVWERNERAIAVYEHLGFRAFDEHVFFLDTEPHRDLLLRLDL